MTNDCGYSSFVALDRTQSLLFRDGTWVMHDQVTQRELSLEPLDVAMTVVAMGQRPVDPSAWVHRFSQTFSITTDHASQLLDQLLQAHVYVETDARGRALTQGLSRGASWEDFNWVRAANYHRHVRAQVFHDWSQPETSSLDQSLMKGYLARELPPPHFKTVAGPRLALPVWDSNGHSEPIRDTITSTGPSAGTLLTKEEIGHILKVVSGVTGTRRLPITGEHPVRTAPSGGSRHPTETYLLACTVDDLEPGVYHYSPKQHELVAVLDGDPTAMIERDLVIVRGRMRFKPAACLLFTSMPERSWFRYREARSYRVLFLDVGHMMQNFAYVASSINRASYRGYLPRSGALENLLGLENLRELPIAFGALA